METIISKFENTIKHVQALHQTFDQKDNFDVSDIQDYQNYQANLRRLGEKLEQLNYGSQLYTQKGRQMILSDFFEYVFFGRLYYSLKKESADRGYFISAVLSFVNLLMCFETMTVSPKLRSKFMQNLGSVVPEIKKETHFDELIAFTGKVGLPGDESDGSSELDRYFDTLLPKTAGGLWHELLVYIFLLRNDCGYIIPLLLSQRLIGLKDYIIPPDFLLLSSEKRLYGIEVGTGKEIIQSSNFVLRTAIPTATVDTKNSRTDRCPICKKWIEFCPFVIETYSNLEIPVLKPEIKCSEACTIYDKEEIYRGDCPYSKYRRQKTQSSHTAHPYANNYHYHYQCVLKSVDEEMKNCIINAKDQSAIKTHFPYYSGLEGLLDSL